MREKLATLPLSQLRELAKSQGIKYVSGLRKSELVDRLCEVAEKEKAGTLCIGRRKGNSGIGY